MTIKTGERLPETNLTQMTADGPRPVSTQDFFKGRTVALFAVPGAFTPTCSARHLPGYKDNLATLTDKGVDAVACVSVNDAFVMGAWAEANDLNGNDDIVMLADGNGAFTKAIGLEMDASGFGMGVRSQRYSMLVKDGVVEKLNVEQGGEFKVSALFCLRIRRRFVTRPGRRPVPAWLAGRQSGWRGSGVWPDRLSYPLLNRLADLRGRCRRSRQ